MNRRRLLSLLSALAIAVGLVATLMVFAQDRVFDADSFSTTVASTVRDPAVNEFLAAEISEALVDQVPDLAIGGPLLTDVTSSVLESDVAVGVVELAAFESHRVLFDGGGDSVVLELSDLVVSIQQALAAVSPDLAESIPDEVDTLSVALSSGELTAGTVRLAERLRILTFALVAAAAALMVALVILEASLFRGLARLGFALGSIGLFLIVSRAVGATVLGSYGRVPLEADALVAVWNLVLGDLATWGWVLVVAGGFLASLGWAVANSGHVRDRARELLEGFNAGSTSQRAGLAWAAGLLVVAAWALLSPASLLNSVVRLGGFGLAVFVVARVLDELGLAAKMATLESKAVAGDAVSLRSVGSRLGASALVLLGLGVGAAVLLSNNDDASALVDPAACNGHVELCDRRLDEVTMATAHNAMSSTGTDFYLPNHLSTMRAMLDQGVRGLMIDTVYGRPTRDGFVLTSVGLVDVDSLDEGARAAAEAVQERQTADLGEEAVYLCHGFCEIGALDAVNELKVVREWLEDHPRDVLVLMVQDGTEPDDTAAVFEEAGFGDLVLTHALGAPLPTLGEMIDSGRRVFVMVEESGEGVDWLHPAFEFSQETPFSFASAEEFSCAANRGEPDSPLFVINHFITLARPSNQTINDFDPLLARAEKCQAERGLHPNLIAVDFVSEGDVMAVVDRLNGFD